MDKKAAMKRLKDLAVEQYQIMDKLAQLHAPISQNLPVTEHKEHGSEAKTILNALAPAVKSSVDRLEVPPGMNEVKVRFFPGKGTQVAYDAILKTVTQLQRQNLLPGANYKITAVTA